MPDTVNWKDKEVQKSRWNAFLTHMDIKRLSTQPVSKSITWKVKDLTNFTYGTKNIGQGLYSMIHRIYQDNRALFFQEMGYDESNHTICFERPINRGDIEIQKFRWNSFINAMEKKRILMLPRPEYILIGYKDLIDWEIQGNSIGENLYKGMISKRYHTDRAQCFAAIGYENTLGTVRFVHDISWQNEVIRTQYIQDFIAYMDTKRLSLVPVAKSIHCSIKSMNDWRDASTGALDRRYREVLVYTYKKDYETYAKEVQKYTHTIKFTQKNREDVEVQKLRWDSFLVGLEAKRRAMHPMPKYIPFEAQDIKDCEEDGKNIGMNFYNLVIVNTYATNREHFFAAMAYESKQGSVRFGGDNMKYRSLRQDILATRVATCRAILTKNISK